MESLHRVRDPGWKRGVRILFRDGRDPFPQPRILRSNAIVFTSKLPIFHWDRPRGTYLQGRDLVKIRRPNVLIGITSPKKVGWSFITPVLAPRTTRCTNRRKARSKGLLVPKQ